MSRKLLNLNVLRTTSVYFGGVITLVQFFLQARYFDGIWLKELSFLLMFASVFDMGIYADFISGRHDTLKSKYILSIILTCFVSLLIGINYEPRLALVFLLYALFPLWYLRFVACYEEILIFFGSTVVIVVLGYIAKLDIIASFLLRGVVPILLFGKNIVVIVNQKRLKSLGLDLVFIFTILSTLLGNISLVLSQFSWFQSENIDFFFDKIGLALFVLCQFFLRLKGEVQTLKLNVMVWIIIGLSLGLLMIGLFIPSRYMSDIGVAWLTLVMLSNQRLLELIYCFVVSAGISAIIVVFGQVTDPWLVNAILSLCMLVSLVLLNFKHVLSSLYRPSEA